MPTDGPWICVAERRQATRKELRHSPEDVCNFMGGYGCVCQCKSFSFGPKYHPCQKSYMVYVSAL